MSQKTIYSGFFAVIPTTVLLSISIPANAKLLLGVISSLCLKEGYCWASNRYLGDQLGLKPDTVSDLIQVLKNHQFIDTDYVNEDRDRRIWLAAGMLPRPNGAETEDRTPRVRTPEGGSTYVRGGEHVRTRGVVRTYEGGSTYGLMDIYDDNTNDDTKDKDMSTGSGDPDDDAVLPVLDFKKRYPTESLPYKLADLLISMVLKRRPGQWKKFRATEEGRYLLTQRHAKQFDLMLERDHRPVEQLLEVLQWSQEDNFWKDNILSGEKFRRQYAVLLGQMEEKGIGSMRMDENPALTRSLIGVYRALIANPNYRPSPAQHTKFIIGAERMVDFFGRYQEVERSSWSECLMECLEKEYSDNSRTVYPGNFCSDHTWEVLMPQYLLDAGLVVWEEEA